MADIPWPSTIPDEPDQGSYGEAVVSNLSSFSPDVGPPTVWRRSTIKGTKIQFTLFMTPAELVLFREFFEDDLGDGALPFSWTNPVYGVAKRYMFDPQTPPQWAPLGYGAAYRVSVSLLKLS